MPTSQVTDEDLHPDESISQINHHLNISDDDDIYGDGITQRSITQSTSNMSTFFPQTKVSKPQYFLVRDNEQKQQAESMLQVQLT